MASISTRDAVTAARAYTEMRWPLRWGHRYRPDDGCTCGNLHCGTPGAHPMSSPPPRLTPDAYADALAAPQGSGLIATTLPFDAVFLPKDIGMAAMTALDRVGPVPCLVQADRAVLLVLPGTGKHCLVSDVVEVRSGPESWVALPPSTGVRWDTPPWEDPTPTPRLLMSGKDVGLTLHQVFGYMRAADREAVAS